MKYIIVYVVVMYFGDAMLTSPAGGIKPFPITKLDTIREVFTDRKEAYIRFKNLDSLGRLFRRPSKWKETTFSEGHPFVVIDTIWTTKVYEVHGIDTFPNKDFHGVEILNFKLCSAI